MRVTLKIADLINIRGTWTLLLKLTGITCMFALALSLLVELYFGFTTKAYLFGFPHIRWPLLSVVVLIWAVSVHGGLLRPVRETDLLWGLENSNSQLPRWELELYYWRVRSSGVSSTSFRIDLSRPGQRTSPE